MKFTTLLASVALVFLSSVSGAVAQPHEGGEVIVTKMKSQFPGFMTVLTSPEVRGEMQKFIGRNESKLTEVTMKSQYLNQTEYTFEFVAANGGYIGSSSFTAIATLNDRSYSVKIRQNPTLEMPGR